LRVDRLVLEDFRNYEREAIDFAPGLNLVIGRNAQGKTNLLEAVHCLGGLGSPRTSDAGLVREGAQAALLHADVARGERSVHVDLEIRPGRGMRTLINKTPATGGRALKELVVAVFFGPDQLSLVKGSPEGRRRFLDELVVKLRPARDSVRREWERILRQRNALLRSAPRSGGANRAALQTLGVWDESFCRVGAGLSAARLESLGMLLPYARKRFEAVAGGGGMELSYSSAWLEEGLAEEAVASPGSIDEAVIREALERELEKARDKEMERGLSLVGPQRDDVMVRLTSDEGDAGLLDARTFASQGDQRTCALALKLGEHDLLTDVLREEPLLLLDDVFSELDPSRRRWLADVVRSGGQTLLSSAEPGAAEAAGPGRVIQVTAGHLLVGDPENVIAAGGKGGGDE
jgi:DNA replication and repair protein RecF